MKITEHICNSCKNHISPKGDLYIGPIPKITFGRGIPLSSFPLLCKSCYDKQKRSNIKLRS